MSANRNAFTGLDDLRSQLEQAGWRIYQNHMNSKGNLCNWIACLSMPEGSRDCECNDKPPSYVVTPYHIFFDGHESASAQVDVTGECGSEWFKLMAYSIQADRVMDRLPSVMRALAAAWQAVQVES